MKKITISVEQINQRIDKFLVKELSSYTRADIIRAISSANVKVNGKETKPSYKLRENDVVEATVVPTTISLLPNSEIDLDILEENDNFIVINKPAGLQVHPDSHERKNTLVNAIIARLPKIKNVHDDSFEAEWRPGIVHRLDKDTSGIVVIAKNQKTFNALKKLFQDHKIEKRYLALTHRTIDPREGVIEKPIARSTSYKKQVIATKRTKTKTREAITHYKVLATNEKYSLIEAIPLTGRTHQIRLHLFSVGIPIVGDPLYGSRTAHKDDAPRQMLHAHRLNFHLFGTDYSFTAPLPQDFIETTANIDETGGLLYAEKAL